MRNATSRDRVAEQFRDAADAAQALAIQEDEEIADPITRIPARITREKKALMLNALDSNSCLAVRDAPAPRGGAGTVHGIGVRTGVGNPGKRGAPVPVPPPWHRGNWMTGAWPLWHYIELGALPGAVPFSRGAN